MHPDAAAAYGGFFRDKNFTGLFEAMCRMQIRKDPSVLE
jgi:hypothetical protein